MDKNVRKPNLDWFVWGIDSERMFQEVECEAGVIYHYTSPHGFESILLNCGDADNLTLWASRWDCLNDASEGKVVDEVYRQVCEELLSAGQITPEQYSAICDLKQKNERMFSQEIIRDDGRINYGFNWSSSCDRYICCFSRNKDSLPMWNYYTKGNRYEGYNIGLSALDLYEECRIKCYDGVRVQLYNVEYDSVKQKRIIKKYLLELLEKFWEDNESRNMICYDISVNLFMYSLIFKKDCFAHEEETRLIISIPDKWSDKVEKRDVFEIKHRFANGLVIPYIELKIPKYCVLEANIGPLMCKDNEKEVQRLVLENLLRDNGYDNACVDYSQIPVRF